ncbi:unnamed protein product [Pieris macdunnoughi]|uniref:Uncharacterized protein n=1 Tax=Pieris macdunnoughi TaxID=345717 RepID=A0A821TMR8_9NEOP|nr:unnamed protein product [Pieris macdunnoughi]
MKLFIILTVAALSSGAKLDKTYLPPSSAQAAGGDFLDTPNFGSGDTFIPNGQDVNRYNYEGNFEYRPERTQAAFERNAAILRQDNVNNGDSYSFAFETENGIAAEESGVATNGVEAQGGFSYIGDDGKQYSIRYTADQNGFQPQGDHLPTPPPIPEEILKALEQNARDEAAGIFDDGSYNEAKYESNNYKENYGNYENRYTVDPSNAQTDDDSIITDSAAFRNPNYYQPSRIPSVTKAYLPPRY